jgi:sugar phosphate permease
MDRPNYPPAYQSWATLFLGVAFYFSGFFHRMVTAVMADQLMVDFDIGAAALGNFSSFYYYSYVAVQIPTGILADYWGPRKLLSTGTLLSGFGAFIFAAAASIHMANLGRLIIGAAFDFDQLHPLIEISKRCIYRYMCHTRIASRGLRRTCFNGKRKKD